MKRFIFVAAISCLMLTGCFKSVEKPIEGSDLVTYTAKDTPLLGIKSANDQTPLTPPMYIQVVARYGYLLAQRARSSEADPVAWDLLDGNAKSVTGAVYENISYAPGYFILQSAAGKYYLKNGSTSVIGPKQEFMSKDDLLFTKSDDKWGVNGILEDKYDEIIVLFQDGKPDYRFVVKAGKQYSLLGADGKVIKKSVTSQAVKRLEQLSKKYESKNWTSKNHPLSGRTVANLKTAI